MFVGLRASIVALLTLIVLFAPPRSARASTITFNVGSMTPGGVPEIAGDATFREAGFDVEAFWADQVGTPSGAQIGGHFHNFANDEEQHLNATNQLQGILIEQIGDGSFSLNSLDFAVRSAASISGFSPSQVYVLVATSFNPQLSVASQFTPFAVSGTGTLAISGFDNVSKIFISSSASVTFDNIVLGSPVTSEVPEPASLILFGSGAVGMIARRLRRSR